MSVTWILEPYIHDGLHSLLKDVAKARGHEVKEWSDDWLSRWPTVRNPYVMFHGSLGTAHSVWTSSPWTPGAMCDALRFECSAWYPAAADWLLHRQYTLTTVGDFVSEPAKAFAQVESTESVFVRPNSPLKPFSGRVVDRNSVTLAALDHGFYYDDVDLSVVIAPVQDVGREWRYVVSGDRIVAGSGYCAETRSASATEAHGRPWEFATEVASRLDAPEPIYVLDVCEVAGELRVVELNPFSGADLYGCDVAAIVDAVEDCSAIA